MARAFNCIRGCLAAAGALAMGTVSADPADPWAGIPGTVIAQSANPASEFVGSPSIVILPDGSYVASHDNFGPADPIRTEILRSTDRGVTWTKRTEFPAYWSNLFVNGNSLYLLGTTASYGNLVIRKSDDAGATWTSPGGATTGLLRSGAFHTAPTPMVIHNGRIWRAFEDIAAGNGWPRQFRAFLMSAPVDADLLNSASWTFTGSVASSNAWLSSTFNGWLEGNVVVSPEGRLVDVLRADMDPGNAERAAVIDFGTNGTAGSFDPNGLPAENAAQRSGFIGFPGGAKKFSIRKDPQGAGYWALVNPVLPAWSASIPGEIRNTLSLAYSPDLFHWEIRCHVLFHPDVGKHGFQYVDWQFDGDDIIAASRTSWDGNNYHDANFLTFHRIPAFRSLTMEDSVSTGDVTWKFPGITARGTAFAPALLENGALSFSNRTYVWGDVPPQLAESLVTRLGGGVAANLRLHADTATRAYLAASQIAPLPDLSGWTATGQSIFYNDGGKTRLNLYYRDLAAGEDVQTPQTNWTGSLLIVPPASGAVGLWRGESTQGGTVVPDENFTFHGKPSSPPPVAAGSGAFGNALQFSLGQHVDLGDAFPLTRTPFTIAFWLRTNPADLTYRIPISKLATGGYDGYLFAVNAPGQATKLSFVASSNADRLTSATAVNDGLWHHIAVTLVPGGDMVLYLDGREESRRTAPVIRATTAALRFGAQTVSGVADPRFAGWLDEVQIHHSALSEGEITSMVLDPSRLVSAGAPYTTGVTMAAPAGGLGVEWRAVPGRSYEIRRSITLGEGSWQLQSTTTSTTQTGTFIDAVPETRAFFRVDMVR